MMESDAEVAVSSVESDVSSTSCSDTETSNTPPSAIARVFSISQLLEEILLRLPGTTLIPAKRVCRSWRDAVSTLERCMTPLAFWKRLCQRDIPLVCLCSMCEYNISADVDAALREVAHFLDRAVLKRHQRAGLEETSKWLEAYRSRDSARMWRDMYQIWMWADRLAAGPAACQWRIDVIDINEKVDELFARNPLLQLDGGFYLVKGLRPTHSRYVIINCEVTGKPKGYIMYYDLLDNMLIRHSGAAECLRNVKRINYVSTSTFYRDKCWIRTSSDTDIDDIPDDDGLSCDLKFIADTGFQQIYGNCGSVNEASMRIYTGRSVDAAMNIVYHHYVDHPAPPEVSVLYHNNEDTVGVYNKPDQSYTYTITDAPNVETRMDNQFVELAARLYRAFRLPTQGVIRVSAQRDRFIISVIIDADGSVEDDLNVDRYEFYTWNKLRSAIVCAHIFANILVIATEELRIYLFSVDFTMRDGKEVPSVNLDRPKKTFDLRNQLIFSATSNIKASILSVAIDTSPYCGPVVLASTNTGHIIKLSTHAA